MPVIVKSMSFNTTDLQRRKQNVRDSQSVRKLEASGSAENHALGTLLKNIPITMKHREFETQR